MEACGKGPGADCPGIKNTFAERADGKRGRGETDIMFDYMMDIDDILDFYHTDYVVLEGDSGANCPAIITGRTIEQLDAQYDERILAVSGVISETLEQYRGLPIINGMTEAEKLVDRIEEKTPDRMPNYSAECCTACGTDCPHSERNGSGIRLYTEGRGCTSLYKRNRASHGALCKKHDPQRLSENWTGIKRERKLQLNSADQGAGSYFMRRTRVP